MNNATGRCVPLPGYYNTGATVAAPCRVNCTTCTSATVCTGCIAGFSLIGGNCIQCSSNCSTCTSTTVCTACFSPYSRSGSVCVLNCTLALGNCTTCVDNAGQVDCTVCAAGFYLDPIAKNCSIVCGDGILASSEGCDDGNNITGDGCDSTCSIEPAFYCNGTVGDLSSCDQC
jgi:cysteine-rich repeat protein